MAVFFTSLIFILIGFGTCTTKTFVEKQKDVLDILDRVYEKSFHERIISSARNYYPGDHPDNYEDFEKVKEWLSHYHEHKWKERDTHFKLFCPCQRKEAIEMFDVFMLANSYESFFETACWARELANQYVFTYAYIVALLNREDTAGLLIPPMYEINPHYFTNTDVIQQAYSAKMKQIPKTINMHFTGTARNPEQRVAYFGEDIGLNNHHFHWHADFPFWWPQDSKLTKDRKGELFFYAHHMLIARFDLERLSNDLPLVEPLQWNKPIKEGFLPKATYRKEGEFPFRPDDMSFEDLKVFTVQDMKDMELRILDAIDLGYMTGANGEHIYLNNTHGINLLGEIIESSSFSANLEYYGSLHNMAHVMLGRVPDPKDKFQLPSGVMEHFETATRDPAFFRLHKYIDNLFKRHKRQLPMYTKEEVDFPGVGISFMSVTGASGNQDELITYLEDFEFDLKNALDSKAGEEHVEIKAKIKRLNHEDFTYNFNIRSLVKATALFRIFLFPIEDFEKFIPDPRHQVKEIQWMMIELDRFTHPIVPGENIIHRNSTDSSATIPDSLSFREIREKIEDGSLSYQQNKRHCGLPHRLLLPKGNSKGMKFGLLVFVGNFDKDKAHDNDVADSVGNSLSYCGSLNERNPDGRPMGYPFDRNVLPNFDMKNIHTKIITIKHRLNCCEK